MLEPGSVISYTQMCLEEGTSLQRGMNYRHNRNYSVVLMSIRKGAPYMDRVEADGTVLIYEGHDIPHTVGGPEPKQVDQVSATPLGTPTQNGRFFFAAHSFSAGKTPAERVRVYEKVKDGIWVYNGLFSLKDAWLEDGSARKIFKFRLELLEGVKDSVGNEIQDLEHNRLIPATVKQEVWARDKGKCVTCGSFTNLHYDHIIPFSKGGSSLLASNIQLMCARHNLAKHDHIM